MIDIDSLKKSTEKEAAKLLLRVNTEFTGQYLVTMIKLFKSVNLFKLFEFEIKCYAFWINCNSDYQYLDSFESDFFHSGNVLRRMLRKP